MDNRADTVSEGNRGGYEEERRGDLERESSRLLQANSNTRKRELHGRSIGEQERTCISVERLLSECTRDETTALAMLMPQPKSDFETNKVLYL